MFPHFRKWDIWVIGSEYKEEQNQNPQQVDAIIGYL